MERGIFFSVKNRRRLIFLLRIEEKRDLVEGWKADQRRREVRMEGSLK